MYPGIELLDAFFVRQRVLDPFCRSRGHQQSWKTFPFGVRASCTDFLPAQRAQVCPDAQTAHVLSFGGNYVRPMCIISLCGKPGHNVDLG